MTNIQPNIVQRPGPQTVRGLHVRGRIIQFFILVFFGIIGLRLVQVQVIEFPKYRDIARKQYQSKIILPATRGTLFDRNGNVIASNSMFVSFAADPQLAADDSRAIATKFSSLFGKPKSYYLDKLHSDSRFVWLERQVDVKYLKKIDLKELDGLVVRYEPKRLYFNDQVAGQLVGCTDIDNNGLAGVELEFESELRGVDGYVILQRDGLGRARPSVDYPRVESVNGHNISLTIDIGLQAIVEKELRRGIEENKAERGIVVMLQPKTGELLAIAQYPHIDPNKFGKYDLQDQKLRAVTDIFEPGSIFKIVTASAALEHGLVTPDKKFFGENGSYTITVSSGKQRTITDTHKEGWITFQEAMEVSSNIVMAKVSDLIGQELFYKMARNYGFGIATNVDIPGEVKGVLKKPVEWSGTTLNTIAFGYEVGVTPIQICAAYGVVANDGVLMQPYVFERETDASGTIIRESHDQQIRRVISSATANTLKEFFEGVVERGTGIPAKIPGMKIAGKTGTSRKYIEGHYETGSYTASFVGFFPADDPQVVCLVMLDNPRGVSYYGGTTSAPVFRAIAERIINTAQIFIPVTNAAAHSTEQTPPPKKSVIEDEVAGVPPQPRVVVAGVVPDVKGYTIRRALGILAMGKLAPVVHGSGMVVSQSPVPGVPARAGMKVTLFCQPRSFSSVTIN